MIWESVWLMGLIDIFVISAVVVLVIAFARHKRFPTPLRLAKAFYLILIGLISIGLFYLVDLFTMVLLPALTSMQYAMKLMTDLHHNWSWIVGLITVSSIGGGTWLLASKLIPEVQSNMLQLEKRVSQRTKDLGNANIQLEDTAKLLIAEQTRFQDFAEIAADWFWEIDDKYTFIYRSVRSQDITGLSDNSVIGKTVWEVFTGNMDDPEKFYRHFNELRAHQAFSVFEFEWITESGERKILSHSGKPMFDEDGIFQGYRGVGRDVTQAHQLSQQLSYQATHDALTGLINRSEFERRLFRVLDSTYIEKSEHALCYIDLDQFKIVNDTCGHVAGDELLRQLTDLLKDKIRQHDTLARLGGDEFGLLLEHCSLDKAQSVAELIREEVTEFQFAWEKQIFRIGVSIGVVAITNNCEAVAELLSAADHACYAAKDTGGNRVHVYQFDDSQLQQRDKEMRWVIRLQEALAENTFELYMQPIVSLAQTEHPYSHIELLIRMKDDGDQIIPPSQFLPAAERYNQSTKIDHWVIATAFKWLSEHQQELYFLNHCAINLSGQSLGDEKLRNFIIEQCQSKEIDAEKICFEITETAAISNIVDAAAFINELHGMGFRFALDDFGSGLSSFAYLKNLRVDFVKIDGMFIKDIVTDSVDRVMVKSINDIGHAMDKKTIAEFVENDDIMNMLREIGVDFAQGYHIQRPQPINVLLNDPTQRTDLKATYS